MKAIKGVPVATQIDIIENYRRDRPVGEIEYRAWCERTCIAFDLDTVTIGRIVSAGERDFIKDVNEARKTEAQRIADKMSLRIEDALEVLGRQLHATSRRPITDKDGRMLRDCPVCEGKGKIEASGIKLKCDECKGTGGNVQWLEKPDNPSQLRAVALTLKLQGAMAPQQIEVNQKHVHIDISTEQLLERYGELIREIEDLKPKGPRRIAGGRADQDRAEGQAGDREQVLLADQMHEDE